MHPSLHTHCTRFLAVSQCRAAVWAAHLPLYIYYIGGQIWCPLADICLPGKMQCGAVEYAARCRGRCSTLRWPTERAASVTAARCIRHRTALRFWWHSSGKQGEATWTGATRAVRRPPFCLQSIGTPYSACRNRRISAKSINFVQLWKSRQGNTMRAVQRMAEHVPRRMPLCSSPR